MVLCWQGILQDNIALSTELIQQIDNSKGTHFKLIKLPILITCLKDIVWISWGEFAS